MASRRILQPLFFAVVLAGNSHAQGGQYRGPGELYSRPEPVGMHQNPGRGVVLTTDLTQWQFWWEVNKDTYLGERLEPALSLEEVEGRVTPLLVSVLERMQQRNMVSAAMIALARSGGEQTPVLDIIRRHLSSRDQQIRETAALALGITGRVAARRDLRDLLHDNRAGRVLVDRNTVDDRTRAFAAHGLGLIARANADLHLQSVCLSDLGLVFEDPGNVSGDLRVAAVTALGMLRIDSRTGDEDGRLLETCLGILERLFLEPGDAASEVFQGHVPKAIAGLVLRGGSEEQRGHYQELFLAELRGRGVVERTGNDVRRAAVLALGQLCQPNDGKQSADAKYSRALLEYYENGKDHQAKMFALIALAQIGGDGNRESLIEVFAQGNKGIEKPWASLALGVYAREAYGKVSGSERQGDVDRGIGRTLHEALGENKNPHTLAALAIGLGLVKYVDAGDDLRALMQQHVRKDELTGYLSVSLALMNDYRALEPVHDLIETPPRPAVAKQAAVALGIFADAEGRALLEGLLGTQWPSLRPRWGQGASYMLGATSWSLGRLGSVQVLKRAIYNDHIPDLNRAAAITAMGILASRDPQSWNAELARNLNYRAAVETLTGWNGILDLY